MVKTYPRNGSTTFAFSTLIITSKIVWKHLFASKPGW